MKSSKTMTVNIPDNERASRINECESILRASVQVAGQTICVVPTRLLRVDDAYQRQIRNGRWGKIAAIASGWDDNKVGAILVSYRAENGYFFVIDGQGRFQAAKQSGHEHLLCQVIKNASLEDEAELFLSQDDNKTRVSLQQKIKAGVVAKHENCLKLKEVLAKHGIVNMDEIKAIGTALEIVSQNPKELDWILSVLGFTGWNLAKNGYSRIVLKALHELYSRNFEDMEKISKFVIPAMMANSPEVFRAVGNLTKASKAQYLNMYSLFVALIEQKKETTSQLVKFKTA